MNGQAYEQYRTAKIEGGKVYQDFIIDACWNLLGLAVVQYSSKLYQQNVGESMRTRERDADDYDPAKDMQASVLECYRAIKQRIADGGPGLDENRKPPSTDA